MKTQPLHRSEFVRLLKMTFPAIIPELHGERFGIHSEMSVFCRYTQRAIDAGDSVLVGKCFRFAESLWRQGNRMVKNAVAVSYLEDLSFAEPRGESAFAVLPPVLQQAWEDVNDYLDALLGRDRRVKAGARSGPIETVVSRRRPTTPFSRRRAPSRKR